MMKKKIKYLISILHLQYRIEEVQRNERIKGWLFDIE